ncbi:hypothetical protein LCGC14_0593680 [marine sediment metagenome]|uniref:Uncharacterized protein n=1 Tax=marine sediment metagenome TaxID=412755 RepID=A0A0F9UL71_9ZZZZ
MRKILLIGLLLVSFNTYSQNNVKKNYTAPYFQGSVKVKDTLGVENIFLVDTIRGFSSSTIIIADTVSFLIGMNSARINVDTLGVSANTKQIYLDSASFIKFVEFLNNIKVDSVKANFFGGQSDFSIGKTGEDATMGFDTLKGAPIWEGELNVTDTIETDKAFVSDVFRAQATTTYDGVARNHILWLNDGGNAIVLTQKDDYSKGWFQISPGLISLNSDTGASGISTIEIYCEEVGSGDDGYTNIKLVGTGNPSKQVRAFNYIKFETQSPGWAQFDVPYVEFDDTISSKNIEVRELIYPDTDGGADIGASGLEFGDGYIDSIFADNLTVGTITVDTVQASGAGGLYLLDSTNKGIFIENTGSVGIGTSAPAARLHIKGSGTRSIRTETTTTTGVAIVACYNIIGNQLSMLNWSTAAPGTNFGISKNNLGVINKVGAGNMAIGTDGAGFMVFGTNDTEALRIDNNQNVGIGTSPSSIFHIKATIPGTVGSHPAGQLIIQNPADDTTANVVITAYESDGSGDPDQQLWYLGNSSSGDENIILLNRRDANLALGTNGITFFKMEGDGDIVLFNGTADKDFTLTFDGETNDGIITYMEDEDRFDVDNDFKVSGDLIVTGDMGIFGTQGFADSSITIAMTQDVFYNITNSSSDLYTTGINIGDLVFAGDSIQVVTAGHYEISYDLSFSGANTDKYHLELFVNNIEQSGKGETERDMSVTDVGVSASSTILNIGAGHWVALKIKNVQNNNDATIKAGNITLKKL